MALAAKFTKLIIYNDNKELNYLTSKQCYDEESTSFGNLWSIAVATEGSDRERLHHKAKR